MTWHVSYKDLLSRRCFVIHKSTGWMISTTREVAVYQHNICPGVSSNNYKNGAVDTEIGKKKHIIGIISEKGVIHTLFSSLAYSFCTQNKLLLQSDVWNLVLYWKQIIMLSRAYNTSFQRCLTQFSWFGPLPTMTGHTEDNFHFILNCGRKGS